MMIICKLRRLVLFSLLCVAVACAGAQFFYESRTAIRRTIEEPCNTARGQDGAAMRLRGTPAEVRTT